MEVIFSSETLVHYELYGPVSQEKAKFWILLGRILWRWDGVMWTGLVLVRIGTGGEFL
jgi:hypothetical protein